MAGDIYTEGWPGVDEVIAKVARGEMERNHGALPAEVTAYNPGRATVTANPLVLVVVDGEAQSLPPIQDVQIQWMQGAGWSIVGELQVGDVGWLRPAGADISAWKASGAKESPPLRNSRNSLSDVVFVPGSRPLSAPLSAEQYLAGALVLWVGSQLLLGDSTASDAVALESLVQGALSKISAAYDPHTHVAPSGGGTTSTPSTIIDTSPAPPWPPDVGATKVKAK